VSGVLGRSAAALRTIPGQEAVQIVTVRAVGAEGLLVEKPLDPAAEANLIGVILSTNWPAHFAVPAAAKQHHSGASKSGGQQA